jgi:hypothetical protein
LPDGYRVRLDGDIAYVSSDAAGLQVVDISDVHNPVLMGSFDTAGSTDAVTVAGNYAHVTAFHEGLIVLDISDPANPTVAGSFHEVFQFGDVAVSGDLAFIQTGTTGEQHLRLYDVSDLGNIFELDRILLPGDAWNLTAQGNHAYVADGFAGLQIVRAGPDGVLFADDFETSDMSNWSDAVF